VPERGQPMINTGDWIMLTPRVIDLPPHPALPLLSGKGWARGKTLTKLAQLSVWMIIDRQGCVKSSEFCREDSNDADN
jgi:hypothetical protein